MKTVLVIDGADNCAIDCFAVSDRFYDALFPAPNQDIEFIEDFFDREGANSFEADFANMWKSRVPKRDICGIDGTLFYQLQHKKKYYPNKQDSDLDGIGRAKA